MTRSKPTRVLPSPTQEDYHALLLEVRAAGPSSLWAQQLNDRLAESDYYLRLIDVILKHSIETSSYFPFETKVRQQKSVAPPPDSLAEQLIRHTELGMLTVFRLLEIAAQRESTKKST